jgi:antitoxin (DNA-binding transcriptional repressor) of toxin-antitoxin stability system
MACAQGVIRHRHIPLRIPCRGFFYSFVSRLVKNEPLILTINGKPIAALIPLENVDLETVTLTTHPQFLALIERSRTRQKTEGGISSEEMRRRLGQ